MKLLNSNSLWMMLGVVIGISLYLLEGLDVVCYTAESLLGLRRTLFYGLNASASLELLVWVFDFWTWCITHVSHSQRCAVGILDGTVLLFRTVLRTVGYLAFLTPHTKSTKQSQVILKNKCTNRTSFPTPDGWHLKLCFCSLLWPLGSSEPNLVSAFKN